METLVFTKKKFFRTTTKLVEIPENLRCKSCVLRLTLDLDSQTQIVSCADVQILSIKELEFLKNNTKNGIIFLKIFIFNKLDIEKKECETNGECGIGECYNGLCYCSIGFYGPNCLSGSFKKFSKKNF